MMRECTKSKLLPICTHQSSDQTAQTNQPVHQPTINQHQPTCIKRHRHTAHYDVQTHIFYTSQKLTSVLCPRHSALFPLHRCDHHHAGLLWNTVTQNNMDDPSKIIKQTCPPPKGNNLLIPYKSVEFMLLDKATSKSKNQQTNQKINDTCTQKNPCHMIKTYMLIYILVCQQKNNLIIHFSQVHTLFSMSCLFCFTSLIGTLS